MTGHEGVTRYRLDYRPGPLPPEARTDVLLSGFARCRAHGLIGRDPARYGGLAYGNLSVRLAHGFLISGTQTGTLPALGAADLAWVLDCDIAGNRVRASGPARPSSEALTHAQVYRSRTDVNAVIHGHSPSIWRHADALGLPVTAPTADYGTPQMAAEVERLLAAAPRAAPGILVMGGHEDGVIAYAADMVDAGDRLLATLAAAESLADGGSRP